MFNPDQLPYTCSAALFMAVQPILVANSKNADGRFDYSVPASTMLSEGLKLGISVVLLIQQRMQAPLTLLRDNPMSEFLSSGPNNVSAAVANEDNLHWTAVSPLFEETSHGGAIPSTRYFGVWHCVLTTSERSSCSWRERELCPGRSERVDRHVGRGALRDFIAALGSRRHLFREAAQRPAVRLDPLAEHTALRVGRCLQCEPPCTPVRRSVCYVWPWPAVA
eukprot:4960647-Pleurochrysis_carterae.AAC.2